jgi:hypothetical protein
MAGVEARMRWMWLTAGLALAGAFPGAAVAATLSTSAQEVRYTDYEHNADVVVDGFDPARELIEDNYLTATLVCEGATTAAPCPAASGRALVLDMGAGDDIVDFLDAEAAFPASRYTSTFIAGGAGSDMIEVVSDGPATITGDEGDDVIVAVRANGATTIDCGAGADTLILKDLAAASVANCETVVDRFAGPASPDDTDVTLAHDGLSPTPDLTITGVVARAGVVRHDCRIDDDAWEPCGVGTVFGALEDGEHLVQHRAWLQDGPGAPHHDAYLIPGIVYRWGLVDTVVPGKPRFRTRPTTLTRNASSHITLSADDAEDVAAWDCTLDAAPVDCSGGALTTPRLTDGAHVLEARVVDPVGNVSPAVSTSWTVDTTPPAIALRSIPPGSTRERAVITFELDPGATATCRHDGAEIPCSSPFVAPLDPRGSRSFEIVQLDPLGNRRSEVARWTQLAPKVATTLAVGRLLHSKTARARCAGTQLHRCRVTVVAQSRGRSVTVMKGQADSATPTSRLVVALRLTKAGRRIVGRRAIAVSVFAEVASKVARPVTLKRASRLKR